MQIRLHIVVEPQLNNRTILVGQGPAVLAAGTGWKWFDFMGHFLNFNGFCQEIKR